MIPMFGALVSRNPYRAPVNGRGKTELFSLLFLHRMLPWKIKAQLELCWKRGQRRAPQKSDSPERWTCERATGHSSLIICVGLWMRFTSLVNLIRAS